MTHPRRAPPAPIHAGLATLVAGALLDLGAHSGVLPVTGAWAEDTGHLLTLLGMALILAGIVRAGRTARR